MAWFTDMLLMVSGVITLVNQLDREVRSSYTFFVIATDTGTPPLLSSSTVLVTVVDENDNAPIFDAFPASFSVCEDVPIGHSVYTFMAHDLDIGDYGHVVYDFEDGGTNDYVPFSMDRDTVSLTYS